MVHLNKKIHQIIILFIYYQMQLNLYKNLACLSVCLFVCLYTINVKTAEPIGPNFFCGTLRDPGVGLWMIEFSKICL